MKKTTLFFLAILLGLGCGSKPEDIYIGGQPVQLYLVNKSKFDNSKLPAILAGLNSQLKEEFKNTWVVNAQLNFQDPPNPSYRTIILLDNFSQFPTAWRKALGFHTTGTLAYVDIEECKTDDVVSLAISHELLEMLTNPNVEPTGYEVCDPVYLAKYGYRKEGVLVSDFVYPAFYNPAVLGPFDHTGFVKKAMEPAPGGVLFATLQAMLKLSAWHKEVAK